MAMFTTDLDDEMFNKLITQIKHRIHAGQSKGDIAEHYVTLYGEGCSEEVYWAYNSAAILCKYEILESK